MTTTDLRGIAQAAADYRSDLTEDGQTLPPFVACDDLDKAVHLLDEWVSHFIGRMQPYQNGMATLTTADPAPDGAKELEQSSLERRIHGTTGRINAIREALDSMNEGLRL